MYDLQDIKAIITHYLYRIEIIFSPKIDCPVCIEKLRIL
jgi:hypothetical protein